ncbi:hypothetical protein Tco_0596141 [Tanacetum coccineum]
MLPLYTKLILRVKKLEHKVKASKSRRRARVIISNNEEDLEDSYKSVRKIAELYHTQQNRSFSKAEPPVKRQKVREVSGSVEEQSAEKEKEVSEEELKKLLVIVPVEEVYIEALQKPTIDKRRYNRFELKRIFEPDDMIYMEASELYAKIL